MPLAFKVGFLVLLMMLSACGGQGIYSKGYYSGRGTGWPREIHVVQAGETLYSIAWQHGQDYREVALWNGITEPFTIFPQQELKVVKPGQPYSRANRVAANSDKPVSAEPQHNNPVKIPKIQPAKVRSESQKLAWRWPAQGKLLNRFSARDPGLKGIDIEGKNGQPIYAAENGHVVYSGSGLRGYGQLIIVKHNETFLSAYAHNENLLVKEGQKVKKGEHIADMGKTGTDRVKLHFEIRRDGIPVDPFKYLPKQ